MNFSFDNERPIYVQLANMIKVSIVNGTYEPGSKLPSVRDLALSAKVNPNTLQKALFELEEEGLIFTERTNGKFVTTDTKIIEKTKNELARSITENFKKEMNNIGLSLEESIAYLQNLGGKK